MLVGVEGSLRVSRFTGGRHAVNTYWVRDRARGLIIDPGSLHPRLRDALAGARARVACVVLTHGHWDHLGNAAELCASADVPLTVGRAELPLLQLAPVYAARVDGVALTLPARVDTFEAAPEASRSFGIEVHHLPGHTRGSVVLRLGRFVFTGDLLLRESVGRTTRPFGDPLALERSLGALAALLQADDLLLPGHGAAWRGAEALAWLRYRPRLRAEGVHRGEGGADADRSYTEALPSV